MCWRAQAMPPPTVPHFAVHSRPDIPQRGPTPCRLFEQEEIDRWNARYAAERAEEQRQGGADHVHQAMVSLSRVLGVGIEVACWIAGCEEGAG